MKERTRLFKAIKAIPDKSAPVWYLVDSLQVQRAPTTPADRDVKPNFIERAAAEAQAATERTVAPTIRRSGAGAELGQAGIAYGGQGAVAGLHGHVSAQHRQQSGRGADRDADLPGDGGQTTLRLARYYLRGDQLCFTTRNWHRLERPLAASKSL